MTTGDVTHLVEELARLTDAVKRLGALAQQPVQPQSSVERSPATARARLGPSSSSTPTP